MYSLLQFGKGVYFADMSSKSANYCFASKAKNEGLILLCDVSESIMPSNHIVYCNT